MTQQQPIHSLNPKAPPPFRAARLTGDATPEDIESIRRRTSVYVYEAPVRLWHWVNATAILILCLTGWFIGSPPPSMQIAVRAPCRMRSCLASRADRSSATRVVSVIACSPSWEVACMG